MELKFDTDELERIEELSYYNHNYYKLPYIVDGCDVLYQEWQDDDLDGLYMLGLMENDKFVKKFEFYGDMDGNVQPFK